MNTNIPIVVTDDEKAAALEEMYATSRLDLWTEAELDEYERYVNLRYHGAHEL